jgi:hypothetical protein
MRLEGFQMLERLLHDEKLLYSKEDGPKGWERSTYSNIYYSKRTRRNYSKVDSGKQLSRNYLKVQGECRIKCTGAN